MQRGLSSVSGYVWAFASKELMCRNGYGQYVPLTSFPCRADEEDKVSRKAVITGATNIVLGGKSIIQSGQPYSLHPSPSFEVGRGGSMGADQQELS